MNIFNFGGQKDTLTPAPIPERLRKNEKVVMITGNNVEDLEFFYPYYRLNEEGYDVDVVTLTGGSFKGKHGYEVRSSKNIHEIKPADYVMMYLPGGKAPEELRENDAVISFVKQFAATKKPIAAICHGPQILATAGVIKNERIAGWPEIRNEVTKAGATFVDEALVESGQYITARKPGDLHRHMSGVIKKLAEMDTKKLSAAS